MIRWIPFFILLFFSFTGVAKPPAYRLSYDQCLQMALKNNDQIHAAAHDIDVSRGKFEEAHPRGIPVVKYEARGAPVPQDIDNPGSSFFEGDISPFGEFRLEMGSLVTAFGKIKTAQQLAKIGVDASWLKRKKTADEIALKIYQTYEGIVLARQLLDLADQAKDSIQGKMNELEEAKVKDQLEILKLRVTYYEVERKVEEAKKKMDLAFAALKVLMGVSPEAKVDIATRVLAPLSFRLEPLEHYLAGAREYLPDYQLVQKGLQAKEQKLKLEKLAPAPELGIGGFVDVGRAPNIRGDEKETNFTNPFNFTRAGIGLQLKGEFNYVQHRARIKQAEADLLKTIREKKAAEAGLMLEARKTYMELKEARNLMNQASQEMQATRQIVFLTKSNLDIGLGEKKDYLDALQSYLIFQAREYEAIYNYNVAVVTLRQKIGKLYSEQERKKP